MISDIDQQFAAQRNYMVRTQIEARGVSDRRVLDAMRSVPRHLFLPENLRRLAYDDSPVSIGYGQTISQPYIVAYMTELLQPEPTDIVLDLGTGSGYQAAILAQLVKTVYTIEIVPELKKMAETVLEHLKYANVSSRVGDGYYGWPEAAPFNGIVVAAAPGRVPEPLLKQLADGGRLVIPVGETFQYLEVYTRQGGEIKHEKNIPVRFVPRTGTAAGDRT
ncbi:MAG TPA: protein-L-isoaspartate O-methyltransferase [candidate division Zixibacteria bacterium]|nr:protein-L-isoaspartate O-methyltransferase [candidate division Zixibacteria bacterium]